MYGQNAFNPLQFYDDLLFNNEVDSVAAIKLHILVDDRQLYLLSKVEAVKLHLVT